MYYVVHDSLLSKQAFAVELLSTKQAWSLRSIKKSLHFFGLSLRDRSKQRSVCGFREFFAQKIAYYSYT